MKEFKKKSYEDIMNYLIKSFRELYLDKLSDVKKENDPWTYFFWSAQLAYNVKLLSTLHNQNKRIEPFQEYAQMLFDLSTSIMQPKTCSEKTKWEHNWFQHITNVDIYHIFISIINYICKSWDLIENNKIEITFPSYGNDRFFSESLISKNKELKPSIILAQLKSTINEFEELSSKKKHTLKLEFPSNEKFMPVNLSKGWFQSTLEDNTHENSDWLLHTIKIDDWRIMIHYSSHIFQYTAEYYCSWSRANLDLQKDLWLLLDILEYTGLLKFNVNDAPHSYRQNHSLKKPAEQAIKYSIDSKYQHWQQIESMLDKELKRYKVGYTDTYDVRSDYFQLLSNNFSNKTLPYVISFFKDSSYIHNISEFIKYRTAIEVMLWSPAKKNSREILRNTFYVILPHENKDYFDELYQIRNEWVHDWVLWVKTSYVENIKSTAKEIFDSLFRWAKNNIMDFLKYEDPLEEQS